MRDSYRFLLSQSEKAVALPPEMVIKMTFHRFCSRGRFILIIK